MNYVIGEPPRWLIQVQCNRKYLFRAALVGQYLWAEIAAWKTKKGASDPRGWLVLQRGRIKLVTHWVSFAVNLTVG